MAGACIGFLTQNRYKARVFKGDTGSLALGGGLAAMAACTGMFLPLFIASGVFIIETVSVIFQVLDPSHSKWVFQILLTWIELLLRLKKSADLVVVDGKQCLSSFYLPLQSQGQSMFLIRVTLAIIVNGSRRYHSSS
jgi:hypothetical protein